jgi:uncharacterized protein
MPKVRFSEIAVHQSEGASSSHGDIFGWKVTRWAGEPGYWLMTSGQGDPGFAGDAAPPASPMETTTTAGGGPTIDKLVATIISNGGEVVVPKVAVPGRGWLAYCQDSEGTVFGIVQADHSAN